MSQEQTSPQRGPFERTVLGITLNLLQCFFSCICVDSQYATEFLSRLIYLKIKPVREKLSTCCFFFRYGKLLLAILWFPVVCLQVHGYRPVILVHGVNSDGESLSDLAGYIKAASPGTSITALDLYDNLSSFLPLYHQLPEFIKKVRPLMEKAPEGVILICHSQGKQCLIF